MQQTSGYYGMSRPFSKGSAYGCGKTTFMADLGEFAAMNEVYARYFNEPSAGACHHRSEKSPGAAKLEIDAIARVGAGK